MKKINILYAILFILFTTYLVFAQQDYQIVQNFQAQYQQISQAIRSADSLSQLTQLEQAIDKFQSDFQDNKDLLDKSLYPNDFNSSFKKLRDALNLRKQDFTQISTLKVQVSELQIQIDTLNSQNTGLLNRVQELQIRSEKDKKTIAALKRNVSALMVSLNKRDILIMTMIDSLIPPGIRARIELTKGEKQKIYSEAEKTNIINNIKRAIQDNIKFLDVTTLNPDDINNIKKQESQFERLWESLGPRMINIYSAKGQDTKDLNEVNTDFAQWRRALTQEAWSSIRQGFSNHDVNLTDFSNGAQFTSSIVSYINDEIKTAKMQGENAEQKYKLFADTAWYGDIKPKWYSYLADNNMLSVAQKDTIEASITRWQDIAAPSSFKWQYIVIILLLIAIVLLLLRIKYVKKNKDKTSNEKLSTS
jgi:hypothetical protein